MAFYKNALWQNMQSLPNSRFELGDADDSAVNYHRAKETVRTATLH